MKLVEHIDIIKALPIPYKIQLLKLLLEILKDHYDPKSNKFWDKISDKTSEMEVEEFIEKCTYRPPQAVQSLTQRPRRGRHRESSRAMRKNH